MRAGAAALQHPFSLAEEPEAAAREAGRRLFAGEITFVRGVAALSGLPAADRPEACLAGRSNVGKSTLINALAGRRALARASNTPGRTQELNYFAAGDALYLVDLPGYGHAEAPRPLVERWQALLRAYLAGRATLRRAFLLVDFRRGIMAPDREIMALLDRAAVSFQVVLTKADKVPADARAPVIARVKAELATHPAAFPQIALTSARTGEGIETLRAIIAAIAEEGPPPHVHGP